MESKEFITHTHKEKLDNGGAEHGYEEDMFASPWAKSSLGPHSEDLNAKRLAFHAGPCWVKILVADRVAGSIIGKAGKVITDIEHSTGCIMKLSPGTRPDVVDCLSLVGQTFFPGTQERIVVIAGSIEGISAALRIILNKVRALVLTEYRSRQPSGLEFYDTSPTESALDESVDISVRAVVPNSAVSCIIGRGGEVVKDINRRTGAMIRIGDRLSIVHERIVQISGTVEECHAALHEVATRIQSDKNLREHLNVVYTKAAVQSNRPPPILSPASSSMSPTAITPTVVMPPVPEIVVPQVQTPSGSLPVNLFTDIVGGPMYSQQCTISVVLPPGTFSTSLFRKVEAQTGAQIRFKQQTGSVTISGPFGAVHCAHVLLLKETAEGTPRRYAPVITDDSPSSGSPGFPPTATPSPVGGPVNIFSQHRR